jgi:glutathione S-transferase
MGTLEEAQGLATTALEILDRQLGQTDWLAATPHPTVADIACYPYTALVGDGGLSLEPYPGIRRWMQAIAGLPGYVPLPQARPA